MSTIAKKLSVLLLGILCAGALQAQTVSGVVKDSSGEPVVGAFVVEQGTSNGVSTGIDGDFSILVKDASKAVLEVSINRPEHCCRSCKRTRPAGRGPGRGRHCA